MSSALNIIKNIHEKYTPRQLKLYSANKPAVSVSPELPSSFILSYYSHVKINICRAYTLITTK